jgi:serine/threonine protein kinase
MSTLDNYAVLSTVARTPYSKLKAVRLISTGEIFAAKIFKHRIGQEVARNEARVMNLIRSNYVVAFLGVSFSGLYTKKNGEQYTCTYILMEMCTNGDLYDLVCLMRPMTQQVLRLIFGEIVKAVEECHASGFCHRNIKLENFLIDSGFQVKVSDFGMASEMANETHTGITASRYSAPETIRSSQYLGSKADVFSLGVVLFLLHSQTFPFWSLEPTDLLLRAFLTGPETFWGKVHSQNKGKNTFPADLKHLLESMLQPDPLLRFSLDQVKAHEWTLGERSSLDSLRAEVLSKREQAIAAANCQLSLKRRVAPMPGHWRDSQTQTLSWSIDDHKVKGPKEVKCYKYGVILAGLEASVLMAKTYEYFMQIQTEFEVSQEFYQFKGKTATCEGNVEFKVGIYMQDVYNVLEVQLIKGSSLEMGEIIRELKEHIFREDN